MNYKNLPYIAAACLMASPLAVFADELAPNTRHFSIFHTPMLQQIADLKIMVDKPHSSCLIGETQDTHGIHLGSFKPHDGDRNWHYAGVTELLGYIRSVPTANTPGTTIVAGTHSLNAVYRVDDHGHGRLTCSDKLAPPNTRLMVQGPMPPMANSES